MKRQAAVALISIAAVAIPALIYAYRMERNPVMAQTSTGADDLPCISEVMQLDDIGRRRWALAERVAYAGGAENWVFLFIPQGSARIYLDITRSDAEVTRMLGRPYRYHHPKSGRPVGYLGFERAARKAFGKRFCALQRDQKHAIVASSGIGVRGLSKGARLQQRLLLDQGIGDLDDLQWQRGPYKQ